ncbi:MAG: hypothetical protein QM715_07050 [Nibricoccus sp.]
MKQPISPRQTPTNAIPVHKATALRYPAQANLASTTPQSVEVRLA